MMRWKILGVRLCPPRLLPSAGGARRVARCRPSLRAQRRTALVGRGVFPFARRPHGARYPCTDSAGRRCCRSGGGTAGKSPCGNVDCRVAAWPGMAVERSTRHAPSGRTGASRRGVAHPGTARRRNGQWQRSGGPDHPSTERSSWKKPSLLPIGGVSPAAVADCLLTNQATASPCGRDGVFARTAMPATRPPTRHSLHPGLSGRFPIARRLWRRSRQRSPNWPIPAGIVVCTLYQAVPARNVWSICRLVEPLLQRGPRRKSATARRHHGNCCAVTPGRETSVNSVDAGTACVTARGPIDVMDFVMGYAVNATAR